MQDHQKIEITVQTTRFCLHHGVQELHTSHMHKTGCIAPCLPVHTCFEEQAAYLMTHLYILLEQELCNV